MSGVGGGVDGGGVDGGGVDGGGVDGGGVDGGGVDGGGVDGVEDGNGVSNRGSTAFPTCPSSVN